MLESPPLNAGSKLRITLDEGAIIVDERSAELLALDEALGVLAAEYPRNSDVVELRFLVATVTRTQSSSWTNAR